MIPKFLLSTTMYNVIMIPSTGDTIAQLYFHLICIYVHSLPNHIRVGTQVHYAYTYVCTYTKPNLT